jgi:tetratricopeptide (TPR) repeat protein
MTMYAAEVFWKGGTEEKAEAVALATRMLSSDPSSASALKILLASDLAKGDYRAASSRADAILAAQPGFADFESLYAAYQGAGRTLDASRLAQSWRAKDPASEAAAIAWASSLVERGEKAVALDLISRLLAGKGTAAFRSSLYWLQSRLQTGEEAVLSSLRSALMENGMNVDALAAMSDIYVRRADYQRARFYLKQAIAVSPDRADIVERRNVLAQLGVAIP